MVISYQAVRNTILQKMDLQEKQAQHGEWDKGIKVVIWWITSLSKKTEFLGTEASQQGEEWLVKYRASREVLRPILFTSCNR